jgi:predicted ribosomally synthesized peptide with SipW-like signal peptide
MTIIAGMTWALFTDTQTVSNHLQAGDLKITLKRTELTKTTLDAKGKLVTSAPDTDPLTFSNPTTENVFGILENEKIVPGTKYVAQMQLENHSDVAFGYWIEIVCSDKTSGEDLAKQLKVTVNTETDVESTVSDGLKIGSDKNFVDVLEIGENGTFTVAVEFVDEGYSFVDGVLTSKNDAAKTENLTFDLVVYAIQATN